MDIVDYPHVVSNAGVYRPVKFPLTRLVTFGDNVLTRTTIFVGVASIEGLNKNNLVWEHQEFEVMSDERAEIVISKRDQ